MLISSPDLRVQLLSRYYIVTAKLSLHPLRCLPVLTFDRTSVKDGSITVGKPVEPGARLQLFVRDR